MSKEDYIRGLFDGAKMGPAQVPMALRFYSEYFVGTASDLAHLMNENPGAVSSRVSALHERGFIYICSWAETKAGPRAVYCWGPGEPDAPNPKAAPKKVEEKPAAKRKTTLHGTEEVRGAVRTHRMRD